MLWNRTFWASHEMQIEDSHSSFYLSVLWRATWIALSRRATVAKILNIIPHPKLLLNRSQDACSASQLLINWRGVIKWKIIMWWSSGITVLQNNLCLSCLKRNLISAFCHFPLKCIISYLRHPTCLHRHKRYNKLKLSYLKSTNKHQASDQEAHPTTTSIAEGLTCHWPSSIIRFHYNYKIFFLLMDHRRDWWGV